ncbi:MAG: Serine/threonine-protein kinase PrkC [Planctomycetota bacterium]|jgi:serine/threonine protein kinase/biopolymer transport protein ExbD
MSDLTDKRLGEFHLLRRLGSGGMAEVFLAEQTSLQRYVAVKVMKPSLMAHSGEDMLARFRQEAMMAAGLNHPNIVQVYTIGQEGDLHYIAQEFVQGQDLATLLRERGRLDLTSAFHVMKQVAAALKASGRAGIVHRDIKPENILVNKKGEIKVADFGLAQLGDSGDRSKGITMGTPLYMSPEQVQGKELDPRSDIYSLGITCYQLLCGDTPFHGTTPAQIALQHVDNIPPRLEEKNPELPKIVCRLVHRMMAKRRTLRYQSAEEVLEDLRTLSAAHKQGRSLDLVRLPKLEELERKAEQERRKPAKTTGGHDGELADDAVEPSHAPAASDLSAEPHPGRSARSPFQLQPNTAAAPVATAEDDDDDPPPRRARVEESAAIDLTPAVDVTFQLLIFFMVTASFSMQKAFDVPPAKQTEGVSVAVVVQDESQSAVKVQVDADNAMIVEEQDSKRASNYRELLELLKAEKNASPDVTDIQLELHPDSNHEARVIVIDAATQAGFTRVRNKVIEW